MAVFLFVAVALTNDVPAERKNEVAPVGVGGHTGY